MGAPTLSMGFSHDAGPVVHPAVRWGSAAPPPRTARKGSGLGLGVFALVFAVHMAMFALLGTQTLTISSPEQASAGNGPLRVRLVTSKPKPVAEKPVVPPPAPQPRTQADQKVLTSEAPSPRVVEATKPQAALVPDPQAPVPSVPEPVAVPVQQAVAAQTAVATPSAAAAAAKPDMLDLGNAPKQVGQIDCRVPKPDYPRLARRRGEAGTVSIRLTVDEHGRVSAAIERSSGFPDLDASARQAALSAQCKPYVEAGRPIRVTALQPFHFVPAD
jgi:periplasmic protein TonB